MARTKRDRTDATGPVPTAQHAMGAITARGDDLDLYGDLFVPFAVPSRNTIPEHLVPRPPETGSKAQDAWSRNPVVYVVRLACVGTLWITAYWWRFTIATVAVVMVVIMLVSL